MKTLLLGSCFSNNIGAKMLEEGRDVMVNPFGTIFNPASIAASLERLAKPEPFTEDECVMMGAGSQLWGSFSHYTKFARASKSEFLQFANDELKKSAQYYKECSRVIITFGTAWYWRHKTTAENSELLASMYPKRARIVSNCLKIPEREFSKERLSPDEIFAMYAKLLDGVCAGKDLIFTVSPIRHLMNGEHDNTISKAILHLGIDKLQNYRPSLKYFPSYEIMIDTLRDHKWYAMDDVHPSEVAIDTIWRAFREWEKKNCNK